MRRYRRLATVLVALPLLVLMCASATEIDIDIYSEVDCTKNAEVGVILGGQLADLQKNAISSTATHCDQSQRVGRVVVAPSGDNDEELAFAVVTRNDDQGLETCTAATNYQGCIIARRQLHFSPHTALPVRVDLRLACLDKVCDANSTCVAGSCVGATCPPGGCATETVLAAGTTDAGSVDASVAIPDSATIPPPPDANIDAGKCPRPVATTAPTPQSIATDLTANVPVGLGMQTHLVFAENHCQYWYFWVDGGTTAEIHTATSTDLTSWHPGAAISLIAATVVGAGNQAPIAGGNGGNFSVAYRNAPGGIDTFHIVLDQPTADGKSGVPWDIRFMLGDDGNPTQLRGQSLVPVADGVAGQDCAITDGPSVVFAGDGTVYAAAGWYYQDATHTHCDMDVYVSMTPDNGGAWSGSFSWKGYWTTTANTTAHLLLPLLDTTGGVYGAFPDPEIGGVGTNVYGNVTWLPSIDNWDGLYDGGGKLAPLPPQLLFASADASNGANDWNACVKSSTEGHAVRKLNTGSFEARLFVGNAWGPDNLAARGTESDQSTTVSEVGTGLVLMQNPDPNGVFGAFTIDGQGRVNVATNETPTGSAAGAATWSEWTPIPGIDSASWIAGSGCYGNRPVLVWAETTNGISSIKAMDVSSVLSTLPPPIQP